MKALAKLKLFNAHRPVNFTLPPLPKHINDLVPKGHHWRYQITPDVRKFAEETGIDRYPEERKMLLKDPASYFSQDRNVPVEQRQQIYLPDVVLTLIRTPHLPPRFASFWVPLWFSKLDMKDYLRRVYGVEVLHIRSYVELQRVYRESLPSKGVMPKRGRLMRPQSKKKMTVQLVKPFLWPEEPEDWSPWEKDQWDALQKERNAKSEEEADRLTKPAEKNRESIAEQAKAVLRGNHGWKPTWQALPLEKKPIGRPSVSS